MNKLRNLRIGLWALLIVVGLGLSANYLIGGVPQNPVADIGGGTYSLVDHNGERVDQTMLVGQPSLLFFGFTHCPDVCPTTLSDFKVWFDTLGDEAGDLRGFFVTVDPERDTPELLSGYVSWVSDRMTGITGTQAEIDKMIAAWRVFAEQVQIGDEGDYTMNHTASVFLVDRDGQFVGTIAYEEARDVALGKIRRLIAEG